MRAQPGGAEQERATRIGGPLKISSSATAGTEVQLSIPGGVAFKTLSIDHTVRADVAEGSGSNHMSI
jgi:hypothetical protein